MKMIMSSSWKVILNQTRRKDFAERHSTDPENEEHPDTQDCETPRENEKN
jgi:hypothetical protein